MATLAAKASAIAAFNVMLALQSQQGQPVFGQEDVIEFLLMLAEEHAQEATPLPASSVRGSRPTPQAAPCAM